MAKIPDGSEVRRKFADEVDDFQSLWDLRELDFTNNGRIHAMIASASTSKASSASAKGSLIENIAMSHWAYA
jgi:hypothetical protein